MLAAIRPESWNFPLFLHVVGAMLLVGGLLSGIASLGYGRGDARLLRLGFRALLAVAVPGWLLMRTGGAGIYSEEGWDALPEGIDDPAWLRVGALISDAGGLILLARS